MTVEVALPDTAARGVRPGFLARAILLVEYIERGRRRRLEIVDAVVEAGGLLSAMVLTLVLVPCLYVIVQNASRQLIRLLTGRDPARHPA